LRGLGTQVARALRPAGEGSCGGRQSSGPHAPATERRLASRSRASRAVPPLRSTRGEGTMGRSGRSSPDQPSGVSGIGFDIAWAAW
jgi:hypothetical protein